MRKPVIAGNWKLYKTTEEARQFIHELIPLVNSASGVEIVVAPVFTILNTVKDALKGTNINLSAQDCFWDEQGAYTGEVSSTMLLDVGCSHVIIGHSERRQLFGETDETVNRKIRAALRAGLAILFCIGETLNEREAEQTFVVLERQIAGGIAEITKDELNKLIIAYEPVWAIGTGKTASNDQAQEAHKFIRRVVAKLYDNETAENIRIVYGGSVKPENIKGLMTQKDIDGALVGGASLKADSFAQIVRFSE